MIYLNLEDLKTDSFERFINESSKDFKDSINKAEKRAIGKVKPYLRDRYDVNAIFDARAPLRNQALIDILCTLTLSKLHHRNAARKFSDSEAIEQAMKELDKIAAGKITLALPPALEDEKRYEGKGFWGNLRNDDFYI